MRALIQQLMADNHATTAKQDFCDYDIATEGIATAIVADIGHKVHGQVSRVLGWFEGVRSKQQHINDICEDTIAWLRDEDRSNKNLDLDMGALKTWMKTSETFTFRFGYLLSDAMYNEIVSDLKKGDISELERFFEHFVNQVSAAETLNSADLKDRRSATKLLDSARTIKDLIVLVERYRARVNNIFELLQKQDRSIKNFPFQLALRGAADLRTAVKKAVNLAI